MTHTPETLMPVACDVCGGPILSDETTGVVTVEYNDPAEREGGIVEGALACERCLETGEGWWIGHRRYGHQYESRIIDMRSAA